MAALAGAGLGGCGFALRQPPRLTFSSIALTGFAPRSPLAEELRRQLALQVRVQDAPDAVDVVLQALQDIRERSAVASTVTLRFKERDTPRRRKCASSSCASGSPSARIRRRAAS